MQRLNIPRRTQGFTFIEVMVVLLIMAITATVLLKSTASLQDEARHSQTVERANQIKQAILKLSVPNGTPLISGFVADMGRLPNNLHELLEPGYCLSNFEINPLTHPADAAAACPGAWISMPLREASGGVCADGCAIGAPQCPPPNGAAYAASPASCYSYPASPYPVAWAQLTAGWNGPYIQTSRNPSQTDPAQTNPAGHPGADAFTDGFGTEWPDATCTAPSCDPRRAYMVGDTRHNYGWHYDTSGTNDRVSLYSYGANGCFGNPVQYPGCAASPDPSYDAEYPDPTNQPLISPQDWQVTVGDWTDIGNVIHPGTGIDVTLVGHAPTCSINESWCASIGVDTNNAVNWPPPCRATPKTTQAQCAAMGGEFLDQQCQNIPPDISQIQCVGNGGVWSAACTAPDLTARNRICEALGGGTAAETTCQFFPSVASTTGCTAAICPACSSVGGAWTSPTCRTYNPQLIQNICKNLMGGTPDASRNCSGFSNPSPNCQTSTNCLSDLAPLATAGQCLAAGGTWPSVARLCLNVYTIQPDPMTGITGYRVFSSDLSDSNGTPAVIAEDGQPHTLHFAFGTELGTVDPSQGENAQSAPIPIWLPVGNAAISVHQGPCSPVVVNTPGTTTPTYPTPGRGATAVKILPGLRPAFSW